MRCLLQAVAGGFLALVLCSAAGAQPTPPEPPSPIRLPDTLPLKPSATVKAATALLGLGRQRLALVVAQTRVAGVELPAAGRDARAVAAALAKAGYVVMPREDLGAGALRAALKEFRGRLGPRGAGLIYVAGAGFRLDGQAWLLTRDLDPARIADAAALRAAGVPLAELVEALQVSPSSLRLLVVDAAAPLPGLTGAARGLAAPALPEGVMALLSAAPGAEVEPRLPPPLSQPLPTDPRALAGSPFGSALLHALVQPRATGPDALRNARRLAIDGTGGRQVPWIGGRTDEDDELGEPGLIESALPRTPEDAALKAVRRMAGLAEELQRLPAVGNEARKAVPEAPPAPTPGPAAVAGTAAAAATAAEAVLQAEAVRQQAVAAAAQQAVSAATAVAQAAAAGATTAERPSRAAGPERLPDQRDTDGETPKTAPAAPPAPPPPAAAPPPPAPPTTARPPAPPPPMNAYGYAAGDSFTYRRTDKLKGAEVGLVVQLIEQLLADGDLQAQDHDGTQVLDAQGRVRSRSGPWGRSDFQPVEEFHWSRPKRGESRDVAFTERFQRGDARGERHWEGEVDVGRPTTIDTPAGRYRVLPMEGVGWYTEVTTGTGRRSVRSDRSVRWSRTVWYSPDLGHPVAIDIFERDTLGAVVRDERLELLRAQTSRSLPP